MTATRTAGRNQGVGRAWLNFDADTDDLLFEKLRALG